jgi:asparagine synthase (glutamine-hydrolysing)
MHSFSGKYVISFNGEIYNHIEIRNLLDSSVSIKIDWVGHSDTETILNAIDIWGIQKTLDFVEGMFAFALWDKENKELFLCRDRLGEKPLYYGKAGASFVFGSELKALKLFPDFKRSISRKALSEYVQFNYIPAPLSIYEDIFKLEAGHYLKIPYSTLEVEHFQYWSLQDSVSTSKDDEINNEDNAISLLEEVIESSIKSQMLSDVPIGAFLSGGIDSSLVVAKMQKYSKEKIKTFTIGFDQKEYDESKHASEVAEYLNTEHTTMKVTDEDAMDIINSLPFIYDEPFADSSQIPTYLVSKAAKEDVTVVLSGDAGDEIFGGYNRYIWVPRLWRWLRLIPFSIRNYLSKFITIITIRTWNKIFSSFKVIRPGEKLHKFADAMIGVKSSQDLYFNIIRQWKNPETLVKGISDKAQLNALKKEQKLRIKTSLPECEQMMLLDSLSYLPDDILVKVDRAGMALSLETRIPFINRKIIELAWRVKSDLKIKKNLTKSPLRQILNNHLPINLIDRPKSGFGLPIGEWLRGPLFDWADKLLDKQKIEKEGFFFSAPIQEAWSQHLSGVTDHSSKLWSILMFQAWLDNEYSNTGNS